MSISDSPEVRETAQPHWGAPVVIPDLQDLADRGRRILPSIPRPVYRPGRRDIAIFPATSRPCPEPCYFGSTTFVEALSDVSDRCVGSTVSVGDEVIESSCESLFQSSRSFQSFYFAAPAARPWQVALDQEGDEYGVSLATIRGRNQLSLPSRESFLPHPTPTRILIVRSATGLLPDGTEQGGKISISCLADL